MPAVLKTAYRNRNKQPEFIGYRNLSLYLNIPTSKLKSSGMFDDIPHRYDKSGKILFKYTAAMDAIAKYRVTPPDNLHPMHEFTQADAMLELGMNPTSYVEYVRSGKIHTHISPRTGYAAVYRKDLDRFLREWLPEKLIENVMLPVKRSVAAILLDLTMTHLRRMTREGKITVEPRKRRQPYKYSKTEMLAYIRNRAQKHYRKRPLPEYLPPSIAAAYIGVTENKLANMRQMGQIRFAENPTGTWATKCCYRRSELDDALDKMNLQMYYCNGLDYYTRRAIKYKFLKSERWIDEFIVGKCRRVAGEGTVVAANAECNTKGWLKEDVEKVVASGVEVKIRKKYRMPLTQKRQSSIAQKATPPVLFSNPVEQMEAAIAAAMNAEKETRVARQREVLRKRDAERERLNAIRNVLSGGPDTRQTRPSRTDMLRFAEEPPLVTFLFSSTGHRGKYDEYPNAKDECLFRVSCGINYGKRTIPPSFARAIMNGLKIYRTTSAKFIPSWIILVSATSIITDPMFHRVLADVPDRVGAVAPFGYGYTLPDGSWDRCPETYGSYGLYSEINKTYERVDGITSNRESHPVQVMDGPFVAIRGYHMRELEYIGFFQQLGDQRGLLGPVMSAICRKFSIPMMQVPVESWGSMEYRVRPNTPEMNLAIERIATFVERPMDSLKG